MSVVYATPGVHLDARDLDPDLGQRPRRLRAPGLPGQPPPAARGDQRLRQRAQAGDRQPQRLHRVQAGRERLRDGRPRHALPRARSPTPAAARSARATTAAATAASGRWSRRTRRRCRGWFEAARDGRGRRDPRLPHLPHRARAVPAPRARGSRPMAENGETRTIRTEALARVEGEGAMQVRIRGGEVENVELQIYEPPRFFEAFLRGRDFTEAPDITARICGICPVAYMTSAFNAMEDALGVEVDERIRVLRRLMYCGEWIESHALHVFLLHAPDFFGFDSAWADGARPPRGGRGRRCGSRRWATTCCGRSAAARSTRSTSGSAASTRRRARSDLDALVPALEESREFMRGVGRLGGGTRLPRLRAGLRVRRAAPSGRATRSRTAGWSPPPASTSGPASTRSTSPSSTSRTRPRSSRGCRDGGTYFLGPMARYSLNYEQLSDVAQRGGRRGRARRELPQPVQVDPRPRGRDPLRARRGARA